jgi:hypothetical protein
MDDALITELIAVMIAASKGGNGILTIAGVRCRLEAANLKVERVEQAAAEEDLEELTRFRDALSKRI